MGLMLKRSFLISALMMGVFELLLVFMFVQINMPYDNAPNVVAAARAAAEANFWFGLIQPILCLGICWVLSIIILVLRQRLTRR